MNKFTLLPLKTLLRIVYDSSVVRYIVVGGLSFIIDFSLLFFFHEVLEFRLWVSTAIAFLTSFLFNFIFQKFFAFSSNSHSGWSLVKYIALVVFNTVATVGIVSVFYSFIGWEYAKLLSTLLTTIWNYIAYRFIVFSDINFFRKKEKKYV